MFVVPRPITQAVKASSETTDLLHSIRVAKERMEHELERLQTKEDSSDSLQRRLREKEVCSTDYGCGSHDILLAGDCLANNCQIDR